jgi:hypothetical protein
MQDTDNEKIIKHYLNEIAKSSDHTYLNGMQQITLGWIKTQHAQDLQKNMPAGDIDVIIGNKTLFRAAMDQERATNLVMADKRNAAIAVKNENSDGSFKIQHLTTEDLAVSHTQAFIKRKTFKEEDSNAIYQRHLARIVPDKTVITSGELFDDWKKATEIKATAKPKAPKR